MTPAIDMRRFRLVLGRLLEQGLPGVAIRWGNQPFPRASFPFVSLTMLTAPSERHLPGAEVLTLPTSVDLAFSGATASSERLVDVNAIVYRSTADLDEDHRDAFVQQLSASLDDVTATAIGPATLRVTPTTMGGLWRVSSPSSGVTVTVGPTADYVVQTVSCRLTVSVDVCGKAGRQPEPAEVMATMMAVLDDESVRSTLAAHRIGFSATASSDVRDLSALEGVDVELRVQRDLEFTVLSRRVTEAQPIEQVIIAKGVG